MTGVGSAVSAAEADKAALGQLLLKTGALLRGEFVLKSGQKSAWFINVARVHFGSDLVALGGLLANLLVRTGLAPTQALGAAYKGIVLASAMTQRLAVAHDRDIALIYNRKEMKGHGEGGMLVGPEPDGDIVVVDDVLTAGTAVRGVLPLLRGYPAASVRGLLVAVDRRDKSDWVAGAGEDPLARELGFPIYSIADLTDVRGWLQAGG